MDGAAAATKDTGGTAPAAASGKADAAPPATSEASAKEKDQGGAADRPKVSFALGGAGAKDAGGPLEYKLFHPRKYVDQAEWKSDLKVKAATLEELEKAGADSSADLQLFLSEVVWAVVRNDFSAPRAVELLAKSPVATKEPLQRLFADILWVVGFAATEATTSRESRDEYYMLCSLLEKEAVLPRKLLALSLETEAVPQAVCQVALMKKKHNQAKTKARYTITRYNLLREHTEGYAKLLVLLDRLASLDFEPQASAKQVAESEAVLAEDAVRLAGFGHLCPNRMLSMAIDIYELRLLEAEPCPLAQPLLGLLRRFPEKRLTEVVVFQLLAHAPPPGPSPGRELGRNAAPPVPAVPQPPARPTQFLAIATLIQAGLVDLDVLWTYLDPADSALKKLHDDLMSKYEEEVASLGKVDLGSTSSNKGAHTFAKLFQAFNQAGNQKFRLAAALVSANAWRPAHRVLLHLQRHCKPCLNHHVRSALCDLLKWLIWPALHPSDKAGAEDRGAASVESTFRCTRRFSLGLAAASRSSGEIGGAEGAATNGHTPAGSPRGGAADAPLALRPTTDFAKLLPEIRMVLEHLEYFLHTDLHLLTSLWKVVLLYLKQREKANGGPAVLDDQLVAVVYRHLLPAASLVPNNPFLSDLMWSVMQQLSVFQRFLLYSCWETMYDSFLLKLAYEKTKAATKQILKRVVANAEKKDFIAHQSHFHVCKLCHSNPIPCMEIMLKDVEIGFNVNMIQPYVECTNRCPELTADVMGYMLARNCAKPAGARAFLNQADATLASWLTNLGEFTGRFYKKHPQTDLVGLLTIITKRINGETIDGVGNNGPPKVEYKDESLIRVILENLIEYMGGLLTVTDMNAEQLLCLAGGPRLKSESISIGKKEDNSRKERARQALLSALVDQGLVPILWYSLSQQRHHFLSEEFSEAHSGGGGLKLLGLLFDGNHECFLKLTEFLAQACARERYAALLPPIQQVFSMFEPALAFLVMRHGLPPFGRSPAALAAAPKEAAAPAANAAAVVPAAAAVTPVAEPEAVVELERVVRLFLPKSFEGEGLSVLFYVTFWRLSLQDVFTPTEGYERAAAHTQASAKALEVQKRQLERDRDYAANRDYKALKKEGVRLQDFQNKLREEHLQQTLNHKQVMARLEQEKSRWFTKPSPHATAALVSEMICPRVLTSYSDALFCCHFVRLLIKLKTPGFQLLDFYNSWTIMLTQCIRCCSEREAQIFGVFLREMMSYVLQLRKDEAAYNAEMKDNPCFHRNYYDNPPAVAVEWAQFSDIKKGHSKWEGRIYKAMKAGLDSDEWMEKRNTLLMLSQSYEAFPVVEKYARAILSAIESMKEKEEYTDLKTLATSLAVKLRHQKERWVDRAQPAAEGTGGSKRAEERRPGTGPKSGLTSTAPAASRAASGTASKSSDAAAAAPAAASGGGSAASRDAPPEKRARHDEAGSAATKDGKDAASSSKRASGDRDERLEKRVSSTAAKDGKDAKESKDAPAASSGDRKRTTGERATADRAAGSHEDRPEKRVSQSGSTKDGKEAKDSRDHKDAAASGKRGSGDRAERAPATHDDRPEKRARRTDRDDAGAGGGARSSGGGGSGGTSERGTSDRHGGGSHGSGHPARNALAPAPDQGPYYRDAPSADYNRGGRTGSGSGSGGGGSSGAYGHQSGSSRHSDPPYRGRR